MEVRPQVFVAMSFAPQYQNRYDEVISPAIAAISVAGVSLKPIRVDLSKSGDSIIREIMDGIAHSRLVLADISTIGRDAVTGDPYRNGNVMYEVGVALACRQPHDVLLVRDDNDKFLFDVSTIPHMKLDFTNIEASRALLHAELKERLTQQRFANDARVQMAIASLSGGEIKLLKQAASWGIERVWGVQNEGNVTGLVSIPRLLDKQLIRVAGEFDQDYPAYALTPLGLVVAESVRSGLPIFKSGKSETDVEPSADDQPHTENQLPQVKENGDQP